jgi:hypothetical protein
MRIALIVEGETEDAFLPHLRAFLQTRLSGNMPKFDLISFDGRIPTGVKLKRIVEGALGSKTSPADAVIALTDVYTGMGTHVFNNAADARSKMNNWVGGNSNFFAHAAQHDFEAWLIPYWARVQKLAESNRASPGPNPEAINHNNPPSKRIKEVFRTGSRGKAYVKPRDADRILRGQDLLISAQACPELKALLNTILQLCGGSLIP